MMGDHAQGNAGGGGQAGLQKPDGKGPYVPYQGARAAVERGTVSKVEMSAAEVLAICQALF